MLVLVKVLVRVLVRVYVLVLALVAEASQVRLISSKTLRLSLFLVVMEHSKFKK